MGMAFGLWSMAFRYRDSPPQRSMVYSPSGKVPHNLQSGCEPGVSLPTSRRMTRVRPSLTDNCIRSSPDLPCCHRMLPSYDLIVRYASVFVSDIVVNIYCKSLS